MRFYVTLVFGLALLSGSISAQAALPVSAFSPTLSSDGIGPLEGIEDLPHLRLEASFWLDSSHNILKVTQSLGPNTNNLGYLIGYRVTGYLQAAIGLYDLATIGIALPVAYLQSSSLDRSILAKELTPPGFGVGDLTLLAHAKLLDEESGPVDLAILLPITMPTANEASYLGESGFSIRPTLVTARNFRIDPQAAEPHPIRLHGELGYQIRKETRLEGVVFNDEVHYSFGVSTSVKPWLDIPVEGFAAWVGSVVFQEGSYGDRIYPQEIQTGGAWALPSQLVSDLTGFDSSARLTCGLGLGLGASATTPLLRVFIGVDGGHQIVLDADQDGIEDSADACPTVAEDIDGLGDHDGCPEDDFDADSILDAEDKCPSEPETINAFEDEDGCPDELVDSDQDGLYDHQDTCPNEAEDKDEFQDDDGCIDHDDDQDGILDDDDSCRLEAEDVDEFEDEDGCPDLDNDQDGIPDTQDACPLEFEEPSTLVERDGCPDEPLPEAPKPDLVEPEVNEPETLLESKASEKEVLVSGLSDTLTQLAKGVKYVHGSKDPARISQAVIKKIGNFLQDHPEIKKIVITGHTDSTGVPKRNRFLSKRRADMLRDRLVQQGIKAHRITTQGKGSSQPIGSNRTKKGRTQNRRIVITVTHLDEP